MKKIEINIKNPYKKYLALSTMRSNHWYFLPDRFHAERIEIQSVTGKEVGTITIK